MNSLTITDVRAHKGDSAFLIDDGNTTILYDTGFGFTGFQVAENIKKVLGDRPLDYIFLTHSHYDHALGSAYILRHYPNAKVVAGEYAAYIFTRDGAKRVMKELDNAFAASQGITDYEFLGDELRVDIPVQDGDVIKCGDLTFIAYNFPGHTKCSVGFYCPDKKLLLSSETLGVYTGEFELNAISPSFLVGYQMSLDSIDKALKLDIEYLLAPHLGILTKEQTAYYLTHIKEASVSTADMILEAINNDMSDEDIMQLYKERFWHGYLKEIYPIDALNLNTSIMIKLIKNEFAEN